MKALRVLIPPKLYAYYIGAEIIDHGCLVEVPISYTYYIGAKSGK